MKTLFVDETHLHDYADSPGHARALCEGLREAEAAELVRQVDEVAERSARSWWRWLRLSP